MELFSQYQQISDVHEHRVCKPQSAAKASSTGQLRTIQ